MLNFNTDNQYNPYSEFNCDNRAEYLEQLAEDTGAPLYQIRCLAAFLGPEEDFDGLVAMIADLEPMFGRLPRARRGLRWASSDDR